MNGFGVAMSMVELSLRGPSDWMGSSCGCSAAMMGNACPQDHDEWCCWRAWADGVLGAQMGVVMGCVRVGSANDRTVAW